MKGEPTKVGGKGGMGPAWTRGEIERPLGEENMGSWTEARYTPEQMARLNVDKYGKAASPSKKANEPKAQTEATEPTVKKEKVVREKKPKAAKEATTKFDMYKEKTEQSDKTPVKADKKKKAPEAKPEVVEETKAEARPKK